MTFPASKYPRKLVGKGWSRGVTSRSWDSFQGAWPCKSNLSTGAGNGLIDRGARRSKLNGFHRDSESKYRLSLFVPVQFDRVKGSKKALSHESKQKMLAAGIVPIQRSQLLPRQGRRPTATRLAGNCLSLSARKAYRYAVDPFSFPALMWDVTGWRHAAKTASTSASAQLSSSLASGTHLPIHMFSSVYR